jgi:hypothetical protein
MWALAIRLETNLVFQAISSDQLNRLRADGPDRNPPVLVLSLFQGGVLFGIIAQYLASAFRHKTLLWSGNVDAPSEPTNVSLERAFQIKTTDPLTPYSYEVPKPIP